MPIKGFKHSEETKKKMSKSHKGQTSGMKGKHFSEESRRKMSENYVGMKGKRHSEETKKKISESRVGKQLSEETKRKVSENNGLGMKGKYHSKETKRKISDRMKGKIPWTKDNHHSEKSKGKMSESHKKLWRDSEYAKMMWESFNRLPNKPEMFLRNLLNQLYPGEWKYVGNGKMFLDGKCPDFVNVNGQKKLIELFGDYWHKGENPQDRINIFKPFGWNTLVIWEHELRGFRALRRKIFDFVESEGGEK